VYNANNQLTKWGNKNLSYDLNGNLLGDVNNTYSWNARDQLSAVTKTGQTLPSFTYDAFGRRQKKTLGATVTSYLYDGANTVQELTGATPSANMLTGLGVDEVFQRTETAATRTFLSDALGGTLALADSAGVVQTSYTYSPYGETTFTGTASNNTSQYTGRENDSDGLYYYRSRYYHPVFSRFVSEDSIGFAGGSPNLYGYVNNSPTNFTDPSGHCPVCLVIFVAWAAYDAYELVLSGRKHSGGDYLWFVAGLTPVGKAAKLIRGGTLVANPRIAIAGLRGAKDAGHAITQIIYRGVTASDLLNAIRHPAVVVLQDNGRYLYLTAKVAVVMSHGGQIVTAWTRAQFRPEYVALLRLVGAIP
jgi:RHS repeat-associated protein